MRSRPQPGPPAPGAQAQLELAAEIAIFRAKVKQDRVKQDRAIARKTAIKASGG
jgi:hypothetical protein